MNEMLPKPGEFAPLWDLDPGFVFLNHGSFGACPSAILDRQTAFRHRLENQPVRFLIREMETLFDAARHKVALFAGALPQNLVFVQNATTAVNTVFRSLRFNQGDEIIFTSHIYPACKRVLEYIAVTTGARLIEAKVGFSVSSSDDITGAVLGRVSSKTRIALIDHISSATAMIYPVDELVRELNRRGVDTMIDGAHALGSIPIDLEKTGAAYYTANCHKWLCAPKSAAILYVREDKQKGIIPPVISHAGHVAESFTERFFWPGTYDPSAVLCTAAVIDYLGSVVHGGWPAIMQHNHLLCLEARDLLCHGLDAVSSCPDEMVPSMASVRLPVPASYTVPDYKSIGSFQDHLYQRYRIEVPVWFWGDPAICFLRISAQLYNSPEQYRYLLDALKETVEVI